MATLREGGGRDFDIVCVGYSSGIIEAWSIPTVQQQQPFQQLLLPRLHPAAPRRRTKATDATLRWRGFLFQSIRTLAFLRRLDNTAQPFSEGIATVSTNTEQEAKPNIDKAEPVHDYYLVVSMQLVNDEMGVNKNQQQPTSSMVEVLDLKCIFLREKIEKLDDELSLQDFAIPLTPGMELIDSSFIPSNKDHLPKRSHILGSPGADAATNLCENGSAANPRLCLTLPDGTVVLLSCSDDTRMNGAVGLTEDFHQLLLPHPAIGSGRLDFHGSNDHPDGSFVACCVRGGTCFLVPTTANSNDAFNLMAIPFPHDISHDLSEVYIQAFTAGNLMVNNLTAPVLLYAWPSGVVDVYLCGLFQPETPKASQTTRDETTGHRDDFVPRLEKQALEEMIENGSTETLLSILNEVRERLEYPLLRTAEWETLLKDSPSGFLTLKMLCSKEYRQVRQLLLSMAAIDIEL
jgi:hypothetical protein